MLDKQESLALLKAANVFYDNDDEAHKLNLNDVFGWGCADCEQIPDDSLEEAGNLFWRYGWAGILYWASKRRGGMTSEFLDNNRFIEFVRREERLRKDVPNDSKRAYTKITYELGK